LFYRPQQFAEQTRKVFAFDGAERGQELGQCSKVMLDGAIRQRATLGR
jgi:hypothetical protein